MPAIEVNGTTLHYRFDGPEKAPVILLANSLASDLNMWQAQMPTLLGLGYRVLRYDSRGHGRSAVPEGPYSIELLTADAVALLDALGLDRVTFMGCSKGGMVGQMLASSQGQRLHSLVLCDTAAHMPPAEVWNQRIDSVRSQGMEAVANTTIERWFTPAGRARLGAEVAAIRQIILDTPDEGFCACCAAIRDMDQRDTIPSISVPTLILVGEDDPSTPVSAAQFIHERIAGSRLVILKKAAHLANIEQADAFNAALHSFLSQKT